MKYIPISISWIALIICYESWEAEKQFMKANTLQKEKSQTSLLTEGSIFKSILYFSIPLILGNLLQQKLRSPSALPWWIC